MDGLSWGDMHVMACQIPLSSEEESKRLKINIGNKVLLEQCISKVMLLLQVTTIT